MSHHFRRIQYFKASSSCFAGTGCLCCLLLHFHVILSVSLAFSRHLLGIFSACSWHMLSIVVRFLSIPIYVPSCSKDSIYFKVSFSCFAGTGCLCCLLLYLGPDACVVYHCISICFLAFSWHSPAFPWHFLSVFLAFLVLLWVFSGFHTFQSFFFVFCRDRMLVLLIVAFPCISLRFLGTFLAFPWHFWAYSWHLFGIVVSFLRIPICVPSFS